MIRKRILLGAVLAALFAIGWAAGRGNTAGGLYGNLDTFVEILHRVEDSYVNPVEPKQLVSSAIDGMMKQLDPYSQYLEGTNYENLQSVTEGEFGGIGILVSIRDQHPTVISPVEDTPAWRAGIRSGDEIVKIDGQSTTGFTIEQTSRLLRGDEGTKVTVSILSPGEADVRDVELVREVIHTKSVPYAFMVDPQVGYLRLASFSERSGAEVRAGLEQLRRQGARRLILDLRANPGGVLDQAVDAASQFLPKGSLVVSTKGRDPAQNQRYYVSAAGAESQWPLVVLVDGGSASASEILAGAIQDLDRGLLVGHTTFGKGSVQRVYPLRGMNAAVKLTTALYYTPSGRSIHRKVTPSAVDDDSADDEDDSDSTVTATRNDSASAQPVYHTAAGRRVLGGGGITPDVQVQPDSLAPAVAEVERRGLAFRFANRWANTHPEAKSDARVTDAMWSSFVGFLHEDPAKIEPADAQASRPRLEQALRRELARRFQGDAAAAQIALESDAVFQKALEVIRRSRAPRDVFAVADAPLKSGESAARR